MSHRTSQTGESTKSVEPYPAQQEYSIDFDLELARRIGLNLPGALESLIELHGDHLQRLIRRLDGGASSADDLLQETLLKVWESARTYRGDAPLRHWLTKIAVRVCRNHLRGYRRWIARVKALWQQRMEQPSETASAQPSNEEAMHRAMCKLPYADRELLVLYYFEDKSLGHVAAQLGVRESTLHVRLHRSRERLKILLQKAEEDL